jgi:hypothetical protein
VRDRSSRLPPPPDAGRLGRRTPWSRGGHAVVRRPASRAAGARRARRVAVGRSTTMRVVVRPTGVPRRTDGEGSQTNDERRTILCAVGQLLCP